MEIDFSWGVQKNIIAHLKWGNWSDLGGPKRTLLPGANEEINLSQGVHKNIITCLKGVNKESDLS